MPDTVDLRQLECFLAVAEEEHFGRAARRLHVTQQSVSERVARLERELGVPLFERTSRRVRLTPAGEAFRPEARRVLAQVRHAAEAARRAGSQDGELRLGYAPNSGPHLSRVLLPELARRDPSLRVLPIPAYTVELVDQLRAGHVDAALAWHPELTGDLDGAPLFGVPVAVAVPASSSLTTPDRLPHADVAARPLVVLVPRAVHPRLHEHLLARIAEGPDGAALPVTVVAEEPSMDRMLPLVVAGVGLGITFTNLVDDRVSGVVYRRLEPPEPTSRCWLLWRREETRPAVAALVRAVQDMVDDGVFDQEAPAG
ncbi:LysR family transcriptional regulator [Geodermatophilus sp. SYSU D00766]